MNYREIQLAMIEEEKMFEFKPPKGFKWPGNPLHCKDGHEFKTTQIDDKTSKDECIKCGYTCFMQKSDWINCPTTDSVS